MKFWMGAASSKFVNFKMSLRSKSRSRKHHKTKSKPEEENSGPPDATKATGDQPKTTDPYEILTRPIRRKPKVWVVNPDDNDSLSTFPSEYLRKRRNFEDDLKELQSLAESLEEFDVVTQNYPEGDPTTLAKNRKFVIAWKSGLSHRLTKLGAHSTGIPVSATAFCKKGRSKWENCCRPRMCHSKIDEEADVDTYQQHISEQHAARNIVRNACGTVLFVSSMASFEQRQEREKRMAMCTQMFPHKGASASSSVSYDPNNPLGSLSGSLQESPSVNMNFRDKRASQIWSGEKGDENEICKRNFSDSRLLSERKNVVNNKM